MIDRLTRTHLQNLFELSSTDRNTLAQSESETVEYKLSFSKFNDQVLKTCAAYANNRGGYIIFGIENDSRRLEGLDEEHLRLFDQYDIAEASKQLNARFNPSISIRKRTYAHRGLNFGIVYAYQSETKPIIATNGKGKIRDGDIFYRYGGRNDRIKYADLKKILDRNLEQQLARLFKHLEVMTKFGIENTAIMDTESGDVIGPSIGRFVISEEIVNSLKFIKEGEFRETTGAPTLKLVGALQTESGQEVVERHTYISRDDIFRGFLYQNSAANPEEYIRAIAEQTTEYTPIYHYAAQTQMTRNDLTKYISGLGTKQSNTKSKLIERISNDKRLGELLRNTGTEAFEKRAKYRELLVHGRPFEIDVEDMRYIFYAVQTITKSELNADYILDVMQKLFERSTRSVEIDGTGLRKAICYIDLLLNPLPTGSRAV